MPRDVELGAGYVGDALLAAFPGQYRSAEHEVPTTNPSNYMAVFPGNASGRPTYRDPDQGRALQLVNMPGVGQVVVPVEHTMIGGGMDAVVPVDHTIAHHVEEDLSGLDALGVKKWSGHRIGQLAGRAAAQAIAALRRGTPVPQVELALKAEIEKAAASIEQTLRKKIEQIPAMKRQAFAEAWRQVQMAMGVAVAKTRPRGWL
ncbi:MAG: hypothetical protein ACRDZ4_07005 [Egibacteraceae bacterium]